MQFRVVVHCSLGVFDVKTNGGYKKLLINENAMSFTVFRTFWIKY